jgi:hypothetical protein
MDCTVLENAARDAREGTKPSGHRASDIRSRKSGRLLSNSNFSCLYALALPTQLTIICPLRKRGTSRCRLLRSVPPKHRHHAAVAQLVEHNVANVVVVSSNLISRSRSRLIKRKTPMMIHRGFFVLGPVVVASRDFFLTEAQRHRDLAGWTS